MAHLRRNLIAVIVAAMVTAAGLAAADPPPERRFEFTVFSPEPISNLGYIRQAGAAPEPLVFYPTARSPRYAYAGPATVQFADVRTGSVTAEITVPAGARRLLLLFSTETTMPGGAVRYRVQCVNDSPEVHPPGSLQFLNLSGLALDGTLNGRAIALAEGFSDPITVDRPAAVVLRTTFKRRSYQSWAETIPLDSSTRCLVILLSPYRPGSLEVQWRLLLDTPVLPASKP